MYMLCLTPQILDEVEKRRAISPALVQPFMRGIMEAPFPAPGRTITVKNFLPGSGTEVRGNNVTEQGWLESIPPLAIGGGLRFTENVIDLRCLSCTL